MKYLLNIESKNDTKLDPFLYLNMHFLDSKLSKIKTKEMHPHQKNDSSMRNIEQ